MVATTALALAQPRWGESKELVERKGVDIVFVIDSSLSMSAQDVTPSRLYVGKAIVRSMVRALPGNRVALVQAEGEGVVMSPLTVDSAVIDLLLDTTAPGTLPRPGTGLAHGLDLAIGLFPEESEKHRVVILLSDGEDHEGGVDERIERLGEAGVVVHSLGIGSHRGAPMPLPGGQANELKRDNRGDVIVTKLEEDNLRRLAESSGGIYLHVLDAGDDVSTITRDDSVDGDATLRGQPDVRVRGPLSMAFGGRGGATDGIPRLGADRFEPKGRSMTRSLTVALAGLMLAAAGDDEAPEAPRWRYNPRERTSDAIERQADGEANAALDSFGTALSLSPDDPLVRFNAGTASLLGTEEDAGAAAIPLLQSAAEVAAPDLQPMAFYNLRQRAPSPLRHCQKRSSPTSRACDWTRTASMPSTTSSWRSACSSSNSKSRNRSKNSRTTRSRRSRISNSSNNNSNSRSSSKRNRSRASKSSSNRSSPTTVPYRSSRSSQT